MEYGKMPSVAQDGNTGVTISHKPRTKCHVPCATCKHGPIV